ncbi:MAG: YihY/virulence factor BrkB family protein, partial [Candidatus Electrothrix sp. AR3]|nr:YihY/virulence factor BrkB family protein [Candidatus Electrothrix sp. AR3]
MTNPAAHSKTGSQRLVLWAFARPAHEKPWITMLRSIFRVLIIMVLEFPGTNLSLRASALTFSIILSMVPLLAMSTAVLKGLGNGNQMRVAAHRFIDSLDPEAKKTAHPSPALPANKQKNIPTQVAGHQEEQVLSLSNHLYNAVDTIFDYVENTNFAALGAFGIAGLLIVVIMVLGTVEDAMNAIWHTERGRSLFRKIMDYLALLVLLPISINIALAGDAALASPKIMEHLTTLIPSVLSVQMLLKLLPFSFVTLSLMMMYLFFPNVRVKTSSAFCGALFGTIFWFIMQRIYVLLQVGIAQYNAIYGSFATVPLFILWIRFGWIFILLGASFAYAIQNHSHYRLPGSESTTGQRLQQTFDILFTVYANFSLFKTTSSEEITARCKSRNEAETSQTITLLIRSGLLHEVEENGSIGFIPSRPADQLTTVQVVRLVLGQRPEVETAGG